MKQINYTGSSKLISRIVSLLNRKAPLPLDGNGDPDWGTNGQVLTTDGSGATSWGAGGGGGDSVSWTQTQLSGDKIAEIDINGTTTNVYAPSQTQADWTEADNTKADYIKNKPNLATVATSGSYTDLSNKPTIPSVGGHTIEKSDGTDMTARANLMFADAKVTDDAVNDRTQVDVIRDILQADVSGISEDGLYLVKDGQAVAINAADVTYNGGSVASALNDINAKIDSPTLGSMISITSLPYTLPSNGYVRFINPGVGSNYWYQTNMGYITMPTDGNDIRFFTKGITIQSASSNYVLRFYPLND